MAVVNWVEGSVVSSLDFHHFFQGFIDVEAAIKLENYLVDPSSFSFFVSVKFQYLGDISFLDVISDKL